MGKLLISNSFASEMSSPASNVSQSFTFTTIPINKTSPKTVLKWDEVPKMFTTSPTNLVSSYNYLFVEYFFGTYLFYQSMFYTIRQSEIHSVQN